MPWFQTYCHLTDHNTTSIVRRYDEFDRFRLATEGLVIVHEIDFARVMDESLRRNDQFVHPLVRLFNSGIREGLGLEHLGWTFESTETSWGPKPQFEVVNSKALKSIPLNKFVAAKDGHTLESFGSFQHIHDRRAWIIQGHHCFDHSMHNGREDCNFRDPMYVRAVQDGDGEIVLKVKAYDNLMRSDYVNARIPINALLSTGILISA